MAELTVAKYMRRRSPRPSSTWRTFLEPHLREIAAIDFFVVTLTFRLLFAVVVLRHDRRELVQINVTNHPIATWAAREVIDAFPYESAPKYLLRDRDMIYGDEFTGRIADMGIREVLIAPRAPWQKFSSRSRCLTLDRSHCRLLRKQRRPSHHDHRARSDADPSGGRKPPRLADKIVDRDSWNGRACGA